MVDKPPSLYKHIDMSSENLRELEYLGWLIKSVQHRHHRALDAQLAPLGVSLVQWNALREIHREPAGSQHYLAERTFNSDQAFGTLANRLQARDLVERHAGAGRAILHRLTRKGELVLRDGQRVMVEVLSRSFANLNKDEHAELIRLMRKVLDVSA